MNYERFAYLYDQLMEEAPYDRWLEFTEQMITEFLPGRKKVLDVGCGTGEILLRLAKNGFEASGVDLSNDMLTVAHEKLEKEGFHVPLFELDMRDLQGLEPFDVIVSYCDSLNYLKEEADVQATFASFYDTLAEGGLLLFDVHSPYKIDVVFKDAVFADDEEECSYIWKSFAGEHPYSVEHELTFFVQDEGGSYYRFEELHQQRTYTVERYHQFLEQAGFRVLVTYADFNEVVSEQSERIFFVAKKM